MSWEPFEKLTERAKEKLEPLGLRMLSAAFIPGMGHGPNTAHLAFEIDTYALLSPEDQADHDALKGIVDATRDAEAATRRADMATGARQGLINLAGGGVLPEDPDHPE